MLQRVSIISNNIKCEPRCLLTDFRQLHLAQLAYARDLGITPAARMAIKAGQLARAAVAMANGECRARIDEEPPLL
jgi:hypothetical protein